MSGDFIKEFTHLVFSFRGGDKFRPDNTITVDANKADEQVAVRLLRCPVAGRQRLISGSAGVRVFDRLRCRRGSCRRPWRGWDVGERIAIEHHDVGIKPFSTCPSSRP
jgi:hypothetical protein